jgi:hypothetical protein
VESKDGRVTASVEELAHYNMLLTEAIFELLAEKEILTGAEVKERILPWAQRICNQGKSRRESRGSGCPVPDKRNYR